VAINEPIGFLCYNNADLVRDGYIWRFLTKEYDAKAFNLDMLLVSIVDEVKKVFLDKEHGGESHLWDAYQNVLFKIGERMPFEDSDGKRFIGTIQGVSKDGKLVIATEDSVSKAFALKEVRLLY